MTLAEYITTYNQLKTGEQTLTNNKRENKLNIINLLNTYFGSIPYSLEYVTTTSVVIYLDTLDNTVISVLEDLLDDNINFNVSSTTKYDEPIFSIELTPNTE